MADRYFVMIPLQFEYVRYEMQMHKSHNSMLMELLFQEHSGFNDSCAFGFTNAMRDVRDYYTVEFKDDSERNISSMENGSQQILQ